MSPWHRPLPGHKPTLDEMLECDETPEPVLQDEPDEDEDEEEG